MLNKLEDEHAGVKNSVVNFYLETQGALKTSFLEEYGSEVTYCSVCGEPSQKKICNTCMMKKLVGN
jgi:recombinational DNA repair protein RecR